MHEQDHRPIARAFVNVCHAQTAYLGVVRCVVKVGQILKSFVGCSKKIFNVGQGSHGGGQTHNRFKKVA